jgi:quaternary ammonium compound-resistance protein SugE
MSDLSDIGNRKRLRARPVSAKIKTKFGTTRIFYSHQAGTTLQSIRSVLVAWISLFIAGLFEIGWAIGLKYTDGFSKLWPTVWTVAAMVVSLAFLEYALRTLPVGTAYAIWVGIGAVGTAIMGMWLFNESREIARIVCLMLIVAGVIGLKVVTPNAG